MAITHVNTVIGNHKAAVTSIAQTVTFATASGDTLFAVIAYDNATGIGPGLTVTDNSGLGHTYTVKTANVANSGTANAGVRLAVAQTTLAGNMNGKLVTFSFGATAVTAKVTTISVFRGLPTITWTSTPITGGTTGSLSTPSNLASGSLVIGYAAYEGTAVTVDADTDGGIWQNVSSATTGGNADTNVALYRQFKILDADTGVTFDPSWSSGDAVLALGVAAVGYTTPAALSGTGTLTVTGVTTPKVHTRQNSFDDGLVGDYSLWFGPASLSNVGNALQLTSTGTTSTSAALSGTFYDLNGSSLTWRTGATTFGGTGDDHRFGMLADGNNGVYIKRFGSGILQLILLVGGATPVSVATGVITDPWLRIRETAGTLYFERSTDGASWTTMYSYVHGVAGMLSSAQLYYALRPTTTGTLSAAIDDVNIPPTMLSGIGTLSTSVTLQVSTGATLSGSGTLTTTGGPGFTGAASLSGTGSLATTGAPAPAATASLAGTGTLATVASAPALTQDVALSGSGTLSATGTPALTNDVPLTGTGTLSTSGAPALADVAALSGTGALTTTGASATAGAADLSGTGSLTATGTPVIAVGVFLSGSGTLTVSGTPATAGAAALTGAGTLAVGMTSRSVTRTATGNWDLQETVDTRATGSGSTGGGTAGGGTGATWAVASQVTSTASGRWAVGGNASATLSGTGTLTTTATPAWTDDANLSGTGTLIASGTPAAAASANLSGDGTLTGLLLSRTVTTPASSTWSTRQLVATDASASWRVTSAVTSTAAAQWQVQTELLGDVALSGSGTLSVLGAREALATAELSGTGALTTAGTPTPHAAVVLSGSGSLTTSAEPAYAATVTFTGSGTLTAAGAPAPAGTVALTGTGSLVVSGTRPVASAATARYLVRSLTTVSAEAAWAVAATTEKIAQARWNLLRSVTTAANARYALYFAVTQTATGVWQSLQGLTSTASGRWDLDLIPAPHLRDPAVALLTGQRTVRLVTEMPVAQPRVRLAPGGEYPSRPQVRAAWTTSNVELQGTGRELVLL